MGKLLSKLWENYGENYGIQRKKLAESLGLEDGFLRSFDGGDDSNGAV